MDELYPKVAFDPGDKDFSDRLTSFQDSYPQMWLEIGFGGAEHLVEIANQNPDVGFIGCEAFLNGIGKALSLIDKFDLQNIRILHGDFVQFQAAFPDHSFDRLYLLYPDPWPKKRHWKRRIINLEMLAIFSRLLKTDGQFFFASDIEHYAEWTLRRILESKGWRWNAQRASDWQQPWPHWVRTRYEDKALREGRAPHYLHFFKRDGLISGSAQHQRHNS